ncbi:MAG: hypothetical protein WBB82_02775 [Limnothrix sp.]
MENITQRAQQGSIKAIMQILNQQLRDVGVSTRVVLGVNGILEILCEAGHPENLDKGKIVDCIQRNLDHLSPRTFQKVHIQSCLTNNTQSLWVATLSQKERRKLLWSEHISIHHQTFFQRVSKSLGLEASAKKLAKAARLRKDQASLNRIWQGDRRVWLVVGAIAAASMGWMMRDWSLLKAQQQTQIINENTETQSQNSATTPTDFDAFNQSVRLATQAAAGGQNATTYSEWVDLANRWQQASDLMKLVPQAHPRYTEAQERVLSYRQNSEVALAKARVLAPNSQL